MIRHSSTKVSSLKLTTREMSEIPAFLTPIEIEQYGFLVKSEAPEPINCQFCNKELIYLGVRSLCTKTIFKWKSDPERCSCEKSVRYWEKMDVAVAKTESDRLEKLEHDELRERAKRLFDQSRMGARFKTRTFENFKVDNHNLKAFEAVKRYADNFRKYKDQGIGFILSGPYGSGKTHLAAALAIDLINKEVTVVIGTLISLLGKIRETYSEIWTQENELEILETYSTVDLLIIDDLGKERASEWSLEKLFSIVNTRYENNLPIIVTTNYSMDTLIDKLTTNKNSDVGESIVSRLHEMCRGIYLNAPDHRKEKK
ncbi:DNA replication protein [Desulfosporosinus orientis DSM 765]|uniref:DNA replication protein n=2 Tax=Desulfosporosinus orientis TaxID=1563 RepID=G7W5E2_DESOD|nr:DNA replication protein [Desulfosporosinus orientis DSM 765]